MKRYSVNTFFRKSETRDLGERNLHEKTKLKAFEILLKYGKSVEEIKNFFPKRFNKDVTEDQKSILLNAMKLFDIRKKVVSLFRNGFIKYLDYPSAVKLKQEPKPEESIGERTKLRKQRLNEVAENEKKINLELFKRYFKYSSLVDLHKNLNESINTERNKIQTESINNALTNLKKDTENTPKSNANKIEENNKIIDKVEYILNFNEENQQGSGLKILTPNQMFNRLPISLA